jgi:hypothetical protein
MHDEDPIDLSTLDPARNERRWEQLVQRTAARGLAARRPSFAGQVFAWARPVMAFAAAAAVITWIAAARVRSSTTTASNPADPSQEMIEWARGDAVPTDAEVTDLLGRNL